MKASLRINYIRLITTIPFSYRFLDFEETVKNETYKDFDIPDKYFDDTEESIKVCFEVKGGDLKRKFYFDLFYGENNSYLFITTLGSTYQLLFKDIDLISILPEFSALVKNALDNYDTNNTKGRKRVLIINYPFDNIKINSHNINLKELLPPRKNNNYSFNYSVYDLSTKLILTKVYDKEKEVQILKYVENIKSKISLLTTLINELYQIETDKEYNNKYSCLKK